MSSPTTASPPGGDRPARGGDDALRRLVGPYAFVSVCAALGLIALVHALGPFIPLGIAAFAVVARRPEAAKLVLPTLCAALVAAVALVGFNVVLDFVVRLVAPDHRLPIGLGLVLALVVFGAVAYLVVHGSWSQVLVEPIEWTRARSLVVAGVLALLFIVALPPVLGMLERDAGAVAAPQEVKAQLDVLIVADAPGPGAGGGAVRTGDVTPYADAAGFDVRYTVGVADGKRVRWAVRSTPDEETARGALDGRGPVRDAPPVLRPEADRVLVLLVDGMSATVAPPVALPDARGRAGEVRRWRRIARAAAPAGTPAYALLETTEPGRLDRWTPFLTPGGAISTRALGSQNVTDAAVRLAVAAPTAREDFTLAMRYRPVLLFDGAEEVPRPLSIDHLFAQGKVRECEDRKVAGTRCTRVRRSGELRNGGTHLQLDVPDSAALRRLAREDLHALAPAARTGTNADALAPGAPPPGTPSAAVTTGGMGADRAVAPLPGEGSAVYVHPVAAVRDGRSLLYLDYWWYLPDNPARAGMGAFCGAGLVIPGVSCFDHQSDWEGVTVVIDRSGREPEPLAVHYAQHESVVGYQWSDLRRAWRDAGERAPQGAEETDAADRPLVYLARGTHAGYPTRCRRDRCRQVAHDRGENRYDGGLPWVGNDTGACVRVNCLRMLPTATGGRAPALWNAFTGPWGRRHCLLTYYCDSGSPPAAPGQQDRYQDPTDPDCVGKPGRPGCARGKLVT